MRSRLAGFRRALLLAVILRMTMSQTEDDETEESTGQAQFEPTDAWLGLMTLYNATNGTGWKHNKGWGTYKNNYCNWQGVTCDGNFVAQLVMVRNSLDGTLPGEAMCALDDLAQIKLGGNSLKGTIPEVWSCLTALESFWLDSNQLSGTMPRTFGALTVVSDFLIHLNQISGTIPVSGLPPFSKQHIPGEFADEGTAVVNFAGNRLSGTIPSEIGYSDALQSIYGANNFLSGTIPWQLSKVPLSIFYVGNNRLSGSSAPEFGTGKFAAAIGGFFVQQNRHLDWDLTLLGKWPYLISALAQDCNIQGVLPSTPLGEGAQSLVLDNNHISGTISETFFHSPSELLTLTISNNRLSGTLPASLTSQSKLQGLLANSMRLSGTIPEAPSSQHINQTWAASLTVLSLSRNYIRGSLRGVAKASKLQTLVTSSNFFSCEAPLLENALLLGDGDFPDPATETLIKTGLLVISKGGAVNPFRQVKRKSFRSAALVFAGNPELIVRASKIPPVGAGRLLEKDAIRQGAYGLFAGHAHFKEFIWLNLPAVILVCLVVVCVSVRTRNHSLKEYFKRSWRRSVERDVLSRTLSKTLKGSCAFLACGVVLIVLNAASPGIHDGFCIDDLLRATTASIEVHRVYEWLWVVLACAGVAATEMITRELRSDRGAQRAQSVYRCLRGFTAQAVPARACVEAWKHNMPHKSSFGRRVAYWLLHIPFIVLVSGPAFGFVLSQNVPANSGMLIDILGNTAVVAVLKLTFAAALVPRLAGLLANLKHGVSDPSAEPHILISVYKTQVATMVIFEVVTVLLAPMVAVFLIDEACLRFYLPFSPDLQSLLDAWNLGTTGSAAYRPGFCGRRLVSEFCYVWLMIVTISTFVGPSLWILKVHPKVQAFLDRRREAADLGEYTLTQHHAAATQAEIVHTLSVILTLASFGVLVPPLLLLAPVAVWLKLCALDFVVQHSEISVGHVLACSVLVQTPVSVFEILGRAFVYSTTVLTFVDLEFSVGPILLYAMFVLAELVYRCKHRISSATENWSKGRHSEVVVEVNPMIKPVVAHRDRRNSTYFNSLEIDIDVLKSDEPPTVTGMTDFVVSENQPARNAGWFQSITKTKQRWSNKPKRDSIDQLESHTSCGDSETKESIPTERKSWFRAFNQRKLSTKPKSDAGSSMALPTMSCTTADIGDPVEMSEAKQTERNADWFESLTKKDKSSQSRTSKKSRGKARTRDRSTRESRAKREQTEEVETVQV
eukprot:TRINITY_DN6796_c0_g1_i5.p1 TRINITY_DN6796_c0_g1~~TRINITY_DN6796_c0_g1_i5.p1  ORF type:complete len:1237 (-),score=178.33 TRINITY_DN6796_c0_g1_i5:137-3847(-)